MHLCLVLYLPSLPHSRWQPPPQLKRRRVVEPSKLVTTAYLESKDDINRFLDLLRTELEQAIDSGERIEIR